MGQVNDCGALIRRLRQLESRLALKVGRNLEAIASDGFRLVDTDGGALV